MGGQISKMMGKIFGSKEMRLLMLGLDAAGKTTILYKLKLGQDVTTIPTVGFNVETVTYKNVKFNVWDVGGQDKIRPLWRHYYSGTFLTSSPPPQLCRTFFPRREEHDHAVELTPSAFPQVPRVLSSSSIPPTGRAWMRHDRNYTALFKIAR